MNLIYTKIEVIK